MLIKRFMILYIPVMLGLAMAGIGFAQDSADQLLEKARARASEIEKLKKRTANKILKAIGFLRCTSQSGWHHVGVQDEK